jgi:hypothetical protein
MLGILETKSYAYVEQDTQAYYICKSAAEAMVAEIIDESADINNTAENLTLTTDEFDGVQGMTSANGTMNDGTYNVYASMETDAEGNYTKLFIDAYATYADQEDNLRLAYDITTNSASSNVNSPIIPDVALFAKSDITFGSSGSHIYGDLALNTGDGQVLDLGAKKTHCNSSIDGVVTLYYPEDEDAPESDEVIDCIYEPAFPSDVQTSAGEVEYEVIELPTIPTYATPPNDYYDWTWNNHHHTDDSGQLINGIKDGILKYSSSNSELAYTLNLPALGNNIQLDEFIINANGSDFEIYVGDQDCSIVTGSLEVSGSGSFDIIGEGSLTIYVTDIFDIQGSGDINYTSGANDPSKLTIYYYGEDSLKINGNTRFCGTLVTGKIDSIELNGSTEICGGILTQAEDIYIKGSTGTTPTLLYAPDSDFHLTANNDFYGIAVVNNADLFNGSIYYDDKFITGDDTLSGDYLEFLQGLIPGNDSSSGEETYTFSNPTWEDNNP